MRDPLLFESEVLVAAAEVGVPFRFREAGRAIGLPPRAPRGEVPPVVERRLVHEDAPHLGEQGSERRQDFKPLDVEITPVSDGEICDPRAVPQLRDAVTQGSQPEPAVGRGAASTG